MTTPKKPAGSAAPRSSGSRTTTATKAPRKTAAQKAAEAKTQEPVNIAELVGPTEHLAEDIRGNSRAVADLSEVIQNFQFTADHASKILSERDRTYEFALVHTAQGATARVRLVDISNEDEMEEWPDSLVDFVISNVVVDPETGEQKLAGDVKLLKSDGRIDAGMARALWKTSNEMARAICIRGFMEPKLIASEEDRTSPDEVLVEVIDPDDRKRFMEWNDATQGEANAKARTFLT